MPPGRSSSSDLAPAALIDSHVHFHHGFEIDAFFDAASRNLERAEAELGLEPGARPAHVLLVMETSRPVLIERLDAAPRSAWRAVATAESAARRVEHPERPPILVVEGRQVVTSERLELLAVPCTRDLAAAAPLEATIAEAADLGAVVVLPWGVGKWWGARGRRIARLLDSPTARRVLLGDNGGRPRLGWSPRLLTLGAQRGVPVLRGSDPLPLAGEIARVGSYGSLLRGPFDVRRPASAVHDRLAALAGTPRGFGRGARATSFLSAQLRWLAARRISGAGR